MINRTLIFSLFASLALLGACNNPSQVIEPKIQSTVISGFPKLDTTRTYVGLAYRGPTSNPESLLTVLTKAGIYFSQAILPAYDGPCMRMEIATLTVELKNNDTRITQYGFEPGVGGPQCSVHFVKYTLAY